MNITHEAKQAIEKLCQSPIGQLVIQRLCPRGLDDTLTNYRYTYPTITARVLYKILFDRLLSGSVDRSIPEIKLPYRIEDSLCLIADSYDYPRSLVVELIKIFKLVCQVRLGLFHRRTDRIRLLTELSSLTVAAEIIEDIDAQCTKAILNFLDLKHRIFYQLAISWLLSYPKNHSYNRKYIITQIKFRNLNELITVSSKPLFQMMLALCV